jgi:IclR family transcriptional regulator, pca regulon regulatory protein
MEQISMPQGRDQNRDFVQALANGLDVLAAFGPKQRALTMSQLADITGQSRASTRRAVLTLENLGYLSRDGRSRRLTDKVLELGFSLLKEPEK